MGFRGAGFGVRDGFGYRGGWGGCWGCGFRFGLGFGWGWGWGWGLGWWGPWGLGWYDPWWYEPWWYEPWWGWGPYYDNYYGPSNNSAPIPPDYSGSSSNNYSTAPSNNSSAENEVEPVESGTPNTNPLTGNVAESTPTVLIYLKDGTTYAASDYWVSGGKLHYYVDYSGEASVDMSDFDLQRTVDENAKRGVKFTLKPNPNTYTPSTDTTSAPPANGAPSGTPTTNPSQAPTQSPEIKTTAPAAPSTTKT